MIAREGRVAGLSSSFLPGDWPRKLTLCCDQHSRSSLQLHLSVLCNPAFVAADQIGTRQTMAGMESVLYDLPWLYDLMVPPSRCEAFYRNLAREHGGPILELGCGTGRLSIPLASDGHEVVGLDASRWMLGTAAIKAGSATPHLHFVHGDMRLFGFPQKFSLIIATCNTLGHLTNDVDLSVVLNRVVDHLQPAGIFAFDIVNPDLRELASPSKEKRRDRELIAYDPINQVETVRLTRPPSIQRVALAPMRLRTFFPKEIPPASVWLGWKFYGVSVISTAGNSLAKVRTKSF